MGKEGRAGEWAGGQPALLCFLLPPPSGPLPLAAHLLELGQLVDKGSGGLRQLI